MESLTKAEKIALLDKKLMEAKEGKDIAFTYEETKKLYGRLHSAVNGDGEGPQKAKEKLQEIACLPTGKEKAKRALLNAWPGPYFHMKAQWLPFYYCTVQFMQTCCLLRIKHPEFDQAFWEVVETLTTTSSRKKIVAWLSKAQVKEKYGDESGEMMLVLPSRKHPKNPKIMQFADCDDIAIMEVAKGSMKSVKTAQKLDKDQVAGLADSLNLAVDDDLMEDAQNDFQNDSQAPENMEACMLPTHLKRALKNKEPRDPQDPEAEEEPAKKMGPLDKLSVFGEDEEDVAYTKAKKMGVMMTNIKLKLSQALELGKKARYQPDPRLKKEAQDSLKALAAQITVLEQLLVQKNAKVVKIQALVQRSADVYKEANRVTLSLSALNKNTEK